MSLRVDVFVISPTSERKVLDVPEGHSDLAGFERWRTTVWGSPKVRALGARFFPTLDGNDLTIEPADVPAFLTECALLRANLLAIGADRSEDVRIRLANIEQACHRAQEVGGGVLVW